MDSREFRKLLVVLSANFVILDFQGGDLCDIMERGTHKIHCISGFVKVSKSVGCNPFKLYDPHFPRGGLCEIMKRRTS